MKCFDPMYRDNRRMYERKVKDVVEKTWDAATDSDGGDDVR